MKEFFSGPICVGHVDQRRTIYDLITSGDAGGGLPLYNLAYFAPLRSGCVIGNHYHPNNMWEIYVVLSGMGVMHFKDMDTGEKIAIHIGDKLPFRISVPPRTGHTLVAQSEMVLLIGATSPVTKENMIGAEVF